jgi:hypothetical protein
MRCVGYWRHKVCTLNAPKVPTCPLVYRLTHRVLIQALSSRVITRPKPSATHQMVTLTGQQGVFEPGDCLIPPTKKQLVSIVSHQGTIVDKSTQFPWKVHIVLCSLWISSNASIQVSSSWTYASFRKFWEVGILGSWEVGKVSKCFLVPQCWCIWCPWWWKLCAICCGVFSLVLGDIWVYGLHGSVCFAIASGML